MSDCAACSGRRIRQASSLAAKSAKLTNIHKKHLKSASEIPKIHALDSDCITHEKFICFDSRGRNTGTVCRSLTTKQRHARGSSFQTRPRRRQTAAALRKPAVYSTRGYQ